MKDKMKPYFSKENFKLFQGDCTEIMPKLDCKFNMIFADPPYFLSSGGDSIIKGKIMSVDKGDWDKSNGFEEDDKFNEKWLSECRNLLTEDGTIWVSGTRHNIFSIGQNMIKLNYKILNCVTWVKSNPPPSLCTKVFKSRCEYILWARKNKDVPHTFNYELMKEISGGHQMSDVWKLNKVDSWQKSCGDHPTQKPFELLYRIIACCTKKGDLILDPFNGSGTTGISANLMGRNYIGIEKETEFLELTKRRRLEIEKICPAYLYFERLKCLKK